MAKHDTTRALNLIVEKFSKVLHMHLAFISIYNGSKSAKNCPLCVCSFDRLDNVGKLTNAGGLNKNSVRGIFSNYLFKCLGKITHERATDTAGVHLVYLYTSLGKKSAVNAYFAKLIFNKNDLLALISLFNKLFYKSSLSCTEKSRKNINFCHVIAFHNQIIFKTIISYR